jgi:heme-degrading monooxygenase HmoA
LLRDRENPRQFFSFGPWDSLEAIADFRSQRGLR